MVVFPKVIADGTRDTLITLTNTKNIQAFVHCEYVNGTGICESSPLNAPVFCTPLAANGASPDCTAIPGERCIVSWDTRDFDLLLTRQQPTIWRVSTGRVFDPTIDTATGTACTDFNQGPTERQRCPGFFITAGSLDSLNPSGDLPTPPGAPFFRGELKCYQTDGFDFPNGGTPDPAGMVCGNALKGEAIIGWDPDHPVTGPVISKYNSINFKGSAACDGDGVLRLDGIEYSACPQALEFQHFANNADNIVLEDLNPPACDGTGCPVHTEITLVPCTELFEQEQGERVPLNFQFIDEFETNLGSASPTLECWSNFALNELTGIETGTFWKTQVQPGGRRCRFGTSASNPDCNIHPETPGECHGAPCNVDADCGTGGECAPASGVIGISEQFYYTDATVPATVDPNQLQFATGPAPGTSAASATFLGGFRRGRCRGDLSTPCDVNGDCTSGPGECLTDVIIVNDIPGTEGPIACDDPSDCPQTPAHICQGVVQGVPLSGICVPAP